MLVTDWIRAAVSGVTVDGRELAEQSLIDMEETYSPNVYNARIWLEHLRGTTADSMFKALGDVVEVKTERVKGGALDGRLALFVRIAPFPDLVNMVKNGQKVHLSVEVNPNFASTGRAYLMGLGVTDSPASVGTGIMKFSVAERKQHLFTSPEYADLNPVNLGSLDRPVTLSLFHATAQTELNQLNDSLATLKKEVEEFEKVRQEFNEVKKQIVAFMTELGDTSTGQFERPLATGQYSSRQRNFDY